MTYTEYLQALFAGKKDGIVKVIVKDRQNGTLSEDHYLALDKAFSSIELTPYYAIGNSVVGINTNMIAYQVEYDLYRLYKKGVTLHPDTPIAFYASPYQLGQILLHSDIKGYRSLDHDSKVYLTAVMCGVTVLMLHLAQKEVSIKTILGLEVNQSKVSVIQDTYRKAQDILKVRMNPGNGFKGPEINQALFFLPKRGGYIRRKKFPTN